MLSAFFLGLAAGAVIVGLVLAIHHRRKMRRAHDALLEEVRGLGCMGPDASAPPDEPVSVCLHSRDDPIYGTRIRVGR